MFGSRWNIIPGFDSSQADIDILRHHFIEDLTARTELFPLAVLLRKLQDLLVLQRHSMIDPLSPVNAPIQELAYQRLEKHIFEALQRSFQAQNSDEALRLRVLLLGNYLVVASALSGTGKTQLYLDGVTAAITISLWCEASEFVGVAPIPRNKGTEMIINIMKALHRWILSFRYFILRRSEPGMK